MSLIIKSHKTVIIWGYQCNNRCRFCIDSQKRDFPSKTTAEIKKEMVAARKRGADYLEIIGGETTIRPDAVELVRYARRCGFKTIMMATNGRMFSYPKFAEKIISAGLNSLVFSIHGHNAQLHDSLTRVSGSFRELLAGLENVKKIGFKNIGSNTTVVKQNYRYLPQIGKFIFNLGIRNAEFIFIDPSAGAAYLDFHSYVPKISEAAPYIRKCLNVGKNGGTHHWHIRYVPLCHFRDYLGQISELDEVKMFHSEHLAPDFQNFDVEKSRRVVGRAKAKRCRQCLYDKDCEGIWKEYIRHYGDKELKPIK
jgi:MoaA/NifB/PqqE/SkfB family radical SAM enzyme